MTEIDTEGNEEEQAAATDKIPEYCPGHTNLSALIGKDLGAIQKWDTSSSRTVTDRKENNEDCDHR